MRRIDRPLVWLHGKVKTPPFSMAARSEAGFQLRQVQDGVMLEFPLSRPMPSIGPRCHELRIEDERRTWRIIYRVDSDAVIVADVFAKSTKKTPKQIIENCKRRLWFYDTDTEID